jgi:hypothetical protein
MKIIGTVAILLILFRCMIEIFASSSSDILVITHGSGGDFSGANVLYEKLSLAGEKVKLHNLEKISIDSIDFIKAKTLVVIGLDAINLLMNHGIILSNDSTIFYAHLYNYRMVDYINNIAKPKLHKKTKVTVCITSSQLNNLRNFKKFFAKSIDILSSKLVLNPYSESETLKETTHANIDKISQILVNQTIHLGGSYKNSQNEWVYINNDAIAYAIKNLPLEEGKISILLHPRTFVDCKDDNGKFNLKKLQKRIVFINNIIRVYHREIIEVYLYVPRFIWEKLPELNKVGSNLNISPTPNYDEILFVLNNPNLVKYELKKQFISIDQYNAFASIRTPVYPFIINNKDREQVDYLNHYKQLVTDNPSSLGSRFIIDNIARLCVVNN